MGSEVVLHVYDLSLGAAKNLSSDILGIHVEGVWHTGVVAYGYEYFYGKKVHRKTPAAFEQMFGRPPVKKIVIGETQKTKREFETFATGEEMNQKYNSNTYDLVTNNCNDFSRDALTFLIDESIVAEGTEAADILDNMKLLAQSPSARMLLGFLESSKQFGTNLVSQMMEDGEEGAGATTDSLAAMLDAVLGGGSGRSGERANEETAAGGRTPRELDGEGAQINPEAAFTGLLGIFEGLASGGGANPRATQAGGANNSAAGSGPLAPGEAPMLPDGAEQAARDFGKSILDAINLVNASISTAVAHTRNAAEEDPGRTQTGTNHSGFGPTRQPSAAAESMLSGVVPVRADVREFLASTFSSHDEEIVQRTVLKILEKEGYYSMSVLKGVTEEELMQMGVKRGWAKKMKRALDEFFA